MRDSERAAWERFKGLMEAKMSRGAVEHPDTFERPAGELLDELQAECLDMAGWGFCLWQRIERMRERMADAED